MGMKVNFNNLRKQALYSYSRLVDKLNENIEQTRKDENDPDCNRFWWLTTDDIQKDMDDLRSLLCTIACVYEPDDEEFADLSDVCDSISVFNPEKEDDDE